MSISNTLISARNTILNVAINGIFKDVRTEVVRTEVMNVCKIAPNSIAIQELAMLTDEEWIAIGGAIVGNEYHIPTWLLPFIMFDETAKTRGGPVYGTVSSGVFFTREKPEAFAQTEPNEEVVNAFDE